VFASRAIFHRAEFKTPAAEREARCKLSLAGERVLEFCAQFRVLHAAQRYNDLPMAVIRAGMQAQPTGFFASLPRSEGN
jgi:hypothetical protein